MTTPPSSHAPHASRGRSPRVAPAARAAVTALVGGGLVATGALAGVVGSAGLGLPSASAGQKGVNADFIDGFDGRQLALRRGTTGVYTSSSIELVDVDRDGDDDYARATATCPVGTKVTGGGFFNPLAYPIAQTVAYEPRQWQVWTTDLDAAQEDPDLFAANATCYSPRGPVPPDPNDPELKLPPRG